VELRRDTTTYTNTTAGWRSGHVEGESCGVEEEHDEWPLNFNMMVEFVGVKNYLGTAPLSKFVRFAYTKRFLSL
jgi:hypothetical protein